MVDDALESHSWEFLRLLDEVHGPRGAGGWGGYPFISEMCLHLFEEPDEAKFKAVVGWVDEA